GPARLACSNGSSGRKPGVPPGMGKVATLGTVRSSRSSTDSLVRTDLLRHGLHPPRTGARGSAKADLSESSQERYHITTLLTETRSALEETALLGAPT